MYYVCEIRRPFGILARPYTTEAEAIAASGAIEVEKPDLQARTEVWTGPEVENVPVLTTLAMAAMPVAIH
jgi:hypothetical protein